MSQKKKGRKKSNEPRFLFFYMTNLQLILYSKINKVDSENDPQHI